MNLPWIGRKKEKRLGLLLEAPLDDPVRCQRCDGACCRAFPSVELTWAEYRALQNLGATRLDLPLTGTPKLIIENGCEFLADDRCAIYTQRPQICRRFYCQDG